MAQVKVIQSTEIGIHLSIDKVEYGFNKSTNTFKQRKADGKFVTVTPTAYIRAICKNQLESARWRAAKMAKPTRHFMPTDRSRFLEQERNA